MNSEALRHFLVEANRAGYAGGNERHWTKEPDGSTTISFTDGPQRLHDNFFGGEPYGGRMVVFDDGRPVWMMVYYGWVVGELDANAVYSVLRKALMEMPEDAPFRGPALYTDGAFTYTNTWAGNVTRFSGEERISQAGALIYATHYAGGLVDSRRGL
jgi:hypothetical protein